MIAWFFLKEIILHSQYRIFLFIERAITRSFTLKFEFGQYCLLFQWILLFYFYQWREFFFKMIRTLTKEVLGICFSIMLVKKKNQHLINIVKIFAVSSVMWRILPFFSTCLYYIKIDQSIFYVCRTRRGRIPSKCFIFLEHLFKFKLYALVALRFFFFYYFYFSLILLERYYVKCIILSRITFN